jgi:hypothetical protein
MSTVESGQPLGFRTLAVEVLEQVQQVTLSPGAWDEVAGHVRRMEDALDRGDLAGFDSERLLLQGRLNSDRQVSRAKLDPEKVEAPPPLRSAAENLSRKIVNPRPPEDATGKSR